MGYGYEHVKGIKESKITGIFDSSEPEKMRGMVGRAHSTGMRYHTEPKAQK